MSLVIFAAKSGRKFKANDYLAFTPSFSTEVCLGLSKLTIADEELLNPCANVIVNAQSGNNSVVKIVTSLRGLLFVAR
ncbi:hypothetical protein AB4K05_22740 [Kluyvera sp. STS39-E]|uniref:hypothetical protein n=1 Tax=Kluyvera sp. STS39-E TaxID=3234748 RepID=UPI0034C5EAF3